MGICVACSRPALQHGQWLKRGALAADGRFVVERIAVAELPITDVPPFRYAIWPLTSGGVVLVVNAGREVALGWQLDVDLGARDTPCSASRRIATDWGQPRRGRVNAICSGVIDTPMQDTFVERVASLRGVSVEELGRLRNATVPLGHAASADECAGAI